MIFFIPLHKGVHAVFERGLRRVACERLQRACVSEGVWYVSVLEGQQDFVCALTCRDFNLADEIRQLNGRAISDVVNTKRRI